MKKTYVIHSENLRTKLPLWETWVIVLLLDKYQASELFRGMVYALMALFWINLLIIRRNEVQLNVFKMESLDDKS